MKQRKKSVQKDEKEEYNMDQYKTARDTSLQNEEYDPWMIDQFKVEEEKKEHEKKVEYKTEILGYSLEEVMANKQMSGKKSARKAEGLQNKVLEHKNEKDHQVTK